MVHTVTSKPPWATLCDLALPLSPSKKICMQILPGTHMHHLLTKTHSEKYDLELLLLSCKHYTVGLYEYIGIETITLLGDVAKTWSCM